MNKYIEQIRQIALDNKYTRYYCNIIEKSLVRVQDREQLKKEFGYIELHHILPKSFKLGGERDAENMVFLTAKEHFIVHLCATKMFTSVFKNKMIFAFRQLRSDNQYQHRYMNARLYEKIKPSFKIYTRLYKLGQVKYVPSSDLEQVSTLQNDGWSLEMTPEFKVNNVGKMKGKKHSEESKRKMSLRQKGRPNLKARGRKRSEATILKQKETLKRRTEENPEKYKEARRKGAKIRSENYKNGLYKKPERPYRPITEDQKQKLIAGTKKAWEELKKNPEEYQKQKEKRANAVKERWKNDPELRKRASIYNSKASQKYGITPIEYYNNKLKPLLYLGFLPTSIVKYGLLDMTKCSIVRLIKLFGTEEDKAQFNINKKNSSGSNKDYISFLEYQYNTLLKDKDISNYHIELNSPEQLKIDYNQYFCKLKNEFKSSSAYKGVHRAHYRWTGQLQVNHIKYKEYFSTEEDAAIFYDKKSVELLGPKAKTNFPIENYALELERFYLNKH